MSGGEEGPTMTRRVMYWPDDLWESVKAAAAQESGRRGRQVSAAELVRESVAERIERAHDGVKP